MENAILKNMAHMTYGIYVLTTRFESTINGMIASWVSQVGKGDRQIMLDT